MLLFFVGAHIQHQKFKIKVKFAVFLVKVCGKTENFVVSSCCSAAHGKEICNARSEFVFSVLFRKVKKFTKNYNARGEPLFC